MSKASILIVFLTVLAQLRGQGEEKRGRWGRYGVPPRTMARVGTAPRPLLSAPSKNLAPQVEGTLNDKTIPGFVKLGPMMTHPGVDFDAMKRRNAEFDSLVAGLKSSLSDKTDLSEPFGSSGLSGPFGSSSLSDPFGSSGLSGLFGSSDLSDPFSPPDPSKSRTRISISDPPSRTLSSSLSGRFSDPPPSQSPYSPSYADPSPPSPPAPQITTPFPWLRNRQSISVPSSPPSPPSPPSPSPTPPPAQTYPMRSSTSSSFDPAPPASCAASKANATPPISQYRRPILNRSETLPNNFDVKPNIMEPYPSSKSSNDSTPPSDSGPPSTSPRRFYNFGNKPDRQYNGSSDTKRYGGSTVVSEDLPNDAGKIEIKISGRQIDDDRMSQMIKEAQNAITTVFYYPLHSSTKRGSISFQKVPKTPTIEL